MKSQYKNKYITPDQMNSIIDQALNWAKDKKLRTSFLSNIIENVLIINNLQTNSFYERKLYANNIAGRIIQNLKKNNIIIKVIDTYYWQVV